jgi:hypothetical protein
MFGSVVLVAERNVRFGGAATASAAVSSFANAGFLDAFGFVGSGGAGRFFLGYLLCRGGIVGL